MDEQLCFNAMALVMAVNGRCAVGFGDLKDKYMGNAGYDTSNIDNMNSNSSSNGMVNVKDYEKRERER